MVKPVLYTNRAVAVNGNAKLRFYLPGTNLEESINEDHVDVQFHELGEDPVPVDVEKASVKRSVLIVRARKISRVKEPIGDDELTVVVTNPSTGEESDPAPVEVLFDDEH